MPIAFRVSDSTMTMRVKLVHSTSRLGAIDSTVSSRMMTTEFDESSVTLGKFTSMLASDSSVIVSSASSMVPRLPPLPAEGVAGTSATIGSGTDGGTGAAAAVDVPCRPKLAPKTTVNTATASSAHLSPR